MSTQVIFIQLCQQMGLPVPQTEFVFHPTRKWRFDYCWPKEKLYLEVDGGVWTKGRHTTGSGFVADMEKFNEASRLGWRGIKCVPSDLLKIHTLDLVKDCLK